MSSNPVDPSIQKAADALRSARGERRPIAPVSASFGIQGIEAAYAIAEINTKARLASGARMVGKKVGLTSKAVQKQLGVDQPDFGVLFDDMEFLNGQDVPASMLMQPKVEAEVAFVVGKDLDAKPPAWSEFLVSLEYAVPALEIVDSAIAEGIDPELGFRIVRVESVFGPNARGRYGALGLTQLMPATARSIDRSLRTEAQILEPVTNLRTGFRYLRMMIERYEGDVRLGLLAYNRGLGTVDRALRAGRDPENGYSPKVLGGSGSQYTGKGIIKDEGR